MLSLHFSKPDHTRGIVRQRIASASMHPLGVVSLASWLNTFEIRMFKEATACYSREWMYAQKMDAQLNSKQAIPDLNFVYTCI